MGNREDDLESVDLLIVGAGLAGLTAAYTLQRQAPDLRMRVLEARERIGGRILTVAASPAGSAFDLGPTWVWPGHDHVLALIDDLGVPIFPSLRQATPSSTEAPMRRRSVLPHPIQPWKAGDWWAASAR